MVYIYFEKKKEVIQVMHRRINRYKDISPTSTSNFWILKYALTCDEPQRSNSPKKNISTWSQYFIIIHNISTFEFLKTRTSKTLISISISKKHYLLNTDTNTRHDTDTNTSTPIIIWKMTQFNNVIISVDVILVSDTDTTP
jgi:hypothetical protein